MGTTSIDKQAIADRADLELEDEGNIFEIDGTDMPEEIAGVLENSGVIEIKGDMIRWKI